jgi:L-asparaginase II
MKRCHACKEEKNENTFSLDKTRKDGLQGTCKQCKKETSNKHYIKNKENIQKKLHMFQNETKDIVKKIKENTPCKDCNIKYPFYIMQFDHIKEKNFIISKGLSSRSREDVLSEIKKCEIVCANCHATRTYIRAKKLSKSAI